MSIAAVPQSRAGSTPALSRRRRRAVRGRRYGHHLIPGAERPYTYMYDPPPGVDKQNCGFVMAPMAIADAQTFCRQTRSWKPKVSGCGRPRARSGFSRRRRWPGSYYREAAELACTATGGMNRGFDHKCGNARSQPADPRFQPFRR